MLAAVRTLIAVSALSLAPFVPSSAVAETETEAPSEDVASETPPAPAKVNGTLGAYGLVGGHFGEALTSSGGLGQWLDFGGGVEVGLGSGAGRLAGRIRFSYYGTLDEESSVRHHGVLSAGLSVQLLKGTNKKFGAYALVDFGVSPLVTELRVFVFADVGVGVRYRVAERVELFGEVAAYLRFEKEMYAGPLAILGARFRL